MLSTAYYFLQVLLCSAIMMGYYWIVLRNKKFHQYNRFYLLSVALLSWIVPLIKIQWTSSFSDNERVIRFLTVVADNNTELESVVKSKGFHWSTESLLSILYVSVGGFLLITMLHALYRIYQLLKKNPCRQIEDIFLIITQAKGTPFSFFRYIFWNDEIDIRSASGKQILQHELTHVQQRHSVDKMLIQLILVAGWFNPFFWLLRKEMDMIHEFIADKRSVRDGDTAALAKMLLTAVYPQQQFPLTHPFFFSPIKRRLQMLTNHKNPRFSYLRRLVALPLLAVLIVLFAFRSKQSRIDKPISVASVVENVVGDFRAHVIGDPKKTFSAIPFKSFFFNKTYTIVINPGHGGEDVGARGYDGTKESDLSLAFAKKIKELNSNPNIKVILTRETDVFNTVVKVAEIAEQFSPDLFISVHANNAPPIKSLHGKTKENPSKGAELYIASKDKAYDYENNYQFANMVGNMMSSVANPFLGIKSREKGVYVLQKLKCPSVLIETGFISNKEELKLLKDESYQSKMALSILQGVEQFLATKEKNQKIKGDLDPLNNVNPLFEFGASKVEVQEDKAGNLQSLKLVDNPYLKFRDIYKSSEGLLLLLDGKRISYDQFNRLNSDMIQEITVIKDPVSIKALTDEAIKSIVQITTKSAEIQENGSPNYVITISHTKPIHNVVKVLYLHTDPPTVEGYDLKDPASRNEFARKFAGEQGVDKLVKDAANYYPSKAEPQNIQPSTLPTQVEHPADFPGGEIGWQKYLQKNINLNIPIEKGAPPGKYVVKVTFIVQPNGVIKDFKVKEDPGFGTAEEVTRIFTKGPNWRPAIYKQKTVASFVERKVTFTISEE
ncbi:MAG: N-acetylmuramoyl-L-alanine amidase [Sediminibacterium sp.]|jgi:N-acetylmuramoyl-L-alanine amidase|uniref:N-acetylmuramoyl-L-alanine amidase n=2 Tax=Bacteria TaxID=2 RepID=UPI002ABC4FCE|nr:N-acetylmuramoyl-L-alanine amidase [Sediminibacterium sp.]MDZ4072421.1 N-acetylmuramoyl-L-alanine amidase [Sediminibacterium sp.]